MKRPWGGIALLALVAAVFSYVQPRLRVETDLLDLLPRASGDARVGAAIDRFSTRLSRKVVFLVGSTDPGAAAGAATAFAGALRVSGAFDAVQHEMGAGLAAGVDLYLAHRDTLLSRRDERLLEAHQGQQVLQAAQLAAFTPAGLLRPIDLRRDPLGFGSDWLLDQIPAIGNARLRGTQLTVAAAGRTYVLVMAETAGSPYSAEFQDRAERALASARNAATQAAGAPVEILQSGALQHATHATRTSRREVGLFGTIATVAVLALMLALFRDWRAPALGMLALTAGAAAGISATYFAFGTLHLVALVFGSSLIGVAIDYSMHFYADQFRAPRTWKPADALAHVTRPILFGAGATMLGYAGLLLLPFPGLRQMALISIVGLAVACACVFLIFPATARRSGRPLPSWCARAIDALTGIAGVLHSTRARLAVAFLVLAFAGFGFARLDFADNLRALQMSTPALIGQERRVADLLGTAGESRFLLVSGPTADAVLQAEEALADSLRALQARGGLTSFTAVSRALPSVQRQRVVRGLLDAQVYRPDGLVPTFMQGLGFDEATIAAEIDAARRARAPLTPAEWLASPASTALRDLWLGDLKGAYASVVTLGGIHDVAAVRALAGKIPGVHFVDRVGDISAVLAHYRRTVLQLLGLAYALILAALLWRYGPRDACRLIAAPLGATLLTIAALGVAHVPITLFVVLGLLLLLALGVDYAVFLREAARDHRTALLSVSLSAVTTMLSCGLLAFSSTPLIASIGLTLAVGIGLCWLLALVGAGNFKGNT